MILVDADAGEDWDSRTDWSKLAERAVLAAVACSHHRKLADCELAIEVSVKFTHDEDVKALNAAYRNKEKATNVLAFPMFESDLLAPLASAARSTSSIAKASSSPVSWS